MMSQLKGLGLVALVVVGILASSTYPAPAADTCPALPNAGSTFGGALTNLINKATGGGSSGLSSVGDPVRQLNASQQQKVLGWLRTELDGKWATLAADRAKSEAEKKVEDLKRRIFTRDRMERNAAVVRSRIYDQVGGKVLPSARQGKPLGQIVDEEMARGRPSLASKYADKYKNAIFDAIKADPAKAGEFAGALSAGDYSKVMDMAADWGAAGFGTMVGDVLEEMGYANSKVVWTEAVKHAGAAKNIMLALHRGDQDAAWNIIEEEWKKEVKTHARAAVKTAINFVFDAGNGVGTIGGLTPGDMYLKLVDAEQEFIEWSKNYLREKSEFGDGACIRKYESEFERTNDRNFAYGEFLDCIPTSKYSAFPEFKNQADSAGLNYDAMLRAFLEARRTRSTTAWTPLDWIAEKVKARKAAMERQMVPELTHTEQIMANIAKGVGPVLDNRLARFAEAVLNENQWDKLANEIRQLEQALDQTLAAVNKDIDRIRRYSDAIGKSCANYEENKLVARRALDEGLNLSVTSSRLWDRLIEIDTAACQQTEATRRVKDNATKRASLGTSIEANRAKLASAVENVCALPADIRNAASKAEARKRLTAGLQSAREVEAIAARLSGDAEKLVALSKPNAGRGNAGNGAASARKKIVSEINALKGEIDALAGRFAELASRFGPAHEAMRHALQRIGNLTDPTKEIIERVRACLRPLAAAPVAKHPRTLLAELSQRSTNIGGCRGVVLENWNERDRDPQSSSGYSSSSAWRYRELTLTHSIESLRGKLVEIEGQCPAAAETPPADTSATQQGVDPQAIKTAATDGRSRMQNCVAKALTAFQDTWGKPKIELSGATCSPQRNADIMTKLRQAAADGSQEAKDHIAKLDPVVAAVSRAHAAYQTAKQAYAAGDLSVVRSNLNDAKTTIDQLGGSPDCSDLAAKIAHGLEKANRLDNALTDVGNAVNSCNVAAIERVRRRYGNVNHAAIVSVLRRGNAIIAAIASYEEAKATYSRGDLGSAQSSLTRARRTLSQAGGSVCPDLGKRIESGLGRIDRLSNAIDSAELAAASCEASEVRRWGASLAKVSNPAANAVKAKLKQCGAKTAAGRNAYCEQKYGRGYYAGNPDATGKYYCSPSQTVADAWCNANNPGSGWKAGKINAKGGFACTKSPEQQRAENNAHCRQQYGAGYYAGNPRSDGTYYCLPTQKAANAKCRQINGPGAVAGRINADGSHDCHWSAGARRRQAWADCRRQFGGRLVNVRIFRNGSYQCIYNTGTASGQDTRSSAAAAAAAAAVIQGIIGAIGSSERGRPSNTEDHRHPPAATPPQPRKCPPGYNPYGCN